jgi:GNAT superfamily N-acetyltransferase
MRVQVELASTRGAILRCQYLIAETYNREYDVVFSDDRYDLAAKIEPWPHRYLMISIDGSLAGACGLYLRETYVERFGGVNDGDLQALIDAAGAAHRYRASRKREVTKLVVAQAHAGKGLGRFLLGAAHARAFLQQDTCELQLLVQCAKRSIWQNMHDRLGIRTRVVKPFPLYKVHERYRSESDPMDSRLILPEDDIPRRWYDLKVPGEHEVEARA